jgi:hypothetical protein
MWGSGGTADTRAEPRKGEGGRPSVRESSGIPGGVGDAEEIERIARPRLRRGHAREGRRGKPLQMRFALPMPIPMTLRFRGFHHSASQGIPPLGWKGLGLSSRRQGDSNKIFELTRKGGWR